MIRKTLKNTTKNERLRAFVKRSKIPPEFLFPNRKLIIRGVVIGLFIAFIPMPLQMAAILLFMPLLRFNVPIALAMVWVTNPFTMPPIYMMEYYTGSFFLGTEIGNVEMSIEWFSDNITEIFLPLYVGALFFSTLSASLAYFVVNYFWKRSVQKAKKKHRHHR